MLGAILATAAALHPACGTVPAATQLVTVTPTGTTRASVRLWRRSGDCWSQAAGPWPARLGRNGVSAHHREGDGTTPVGTFAFGPVVYGTGADPSVRLAYHRLACGDWWDEDPGSATYNRFRHVACGTAPPFGGGSEALWKISPQYRYFAVIAYNTSPVVPGRGSAIFLHVAVGATAGCVSLPEARLVQLLRWLRPASRPLIRLAVS
jgi:L,D-peptidoglycan transpeptidase YkuD (ErfK/YbiS/YcfS/YnhG family)